MTAMCQQTSLPDANKYLRTQRYQQSTLSSHNSVLFYAAPKWGVGAFNEGGCSGICKRRPIRVRGKGEARDRQARIAV